MEYDYMDVLRSTHPSKTQVEALLRMLEKNPALAKGHAKSLYGKQKMRKDWARIALTLNRISGGSTKNTQKWMKYWADKKSFVKKKLLKLSQLDRTGSAADEYEDNYQLSPIEGRIVKLISGEPFGKDNKHVEIKVFCKESNLDDTEPTFRVDTTKPVMLQSSQSTDNIGGLELVENIESQNMDTSAVDTLFMEAVKHEPSGVRTRTRSPVADRASPPPSLPSESDSPSPSPEPLPRRRERGRRKPYTIPKNTRRQRRRSASSSSERTHQNTPLTSLTKKLLRIEEQKLKLDQKLFKTLEKVLESNSERERLLAQGAIALGEGLKAMAEVLKSRDGYNGLGNHEFDHGVEGLLPYLENLNAPMLGANVNTTFEPSLTPYIKNHVIIERHGRMIGIIGVLLQVFSAPVGNVIMEDEVEAINREAAILTAQGVDIVIVLSHVGFSSDIAMASRISSDVDIIVGAHTHTLLYNGETPSGEIPVSDYPTVVTQSNGHRIPIVQASCYTRYLGNIKFFIDDGGRVQSWEGQPIYLGTSIVQDPVMMAELEPWRVQVDAVGKEVLARSLVTLNRSWCGRGECNLGDWVCDMLLEEVMPLASGESWNYADVCLINAGGMRVQIDPGNVTTEGLLMALPFENLVQVYDLRGEHLLEALEFAVGVAQSDPASFYSSRMLQVAGLRVVYNASAPIGSRVVSAAVRCGRCDVPRYEPLDEQRVYKVLSQNYIGDGGGGYTMLSENRENLEELELDYVMLQRAMRRQVVIAPSLDGRIRIVY